MSDRPLPMRTTLVDWLRFIVVSAYLGAAGLLLLSTGRLDLGVPLRRLLQMAWHRLRRGAGRIGGPLHGIRRDEGFCWAARVDPAIVSDAEGRSRVVMLEDGRPLPRGHSTIEEIRRVGAGRYLHWKDRVYFSASDGSDPTRNGRAYALAEDRR